MSLERTALNDDIVTRSFKLTLTEETTVVLEPRWGVVVEPTIENGGVYPETEDVTEEQDSESVSAE